MAESVGDPPVLRFDAGAAWLDLVATEGSVDGPDRIERLPTPERLAQWLEREGLTPAAGPADAAGLDAARALRAALRELATAALQARPASAAAVAELNRAAAHPDRPVLYPAGAGYALAPPADVSAALARVARVAASQLSGPEAAQLHMCDADDCTTIFLDSTGRRRWCASERCGVRVRVREHRRRRAAGTDRT